MTTPQEPPYTPRQNLRIPMRLEVAELLVELAEDYEELGPGEADAVHEARGQIEGLVARWRAGR